MRLGGKTVLHVIVNRLYDYIDNEIKIIFTDSILRKK